MSCASIVSYVLQLYVMCFNCMSCASIVALCHTSLSHCTSVVGWLLYMERMKLLCADSYMIYIESVEHTDRYLREWYLREWRDSEGPWDRGTVWYAWIVALWYMSLLRFIRVIGDCIYIEWVSFYMCRLIYIEFVGYMDCWGSSRDMVHTHTHTHTLTHTHTHTHTQPLIGIAR